LSKRLKKLSLVQLGDLAVPAEGDMLAIQVDMCGSETMGPDTCMRSPANESIVATSPSIAAVTRISDGESPVVRPYFSQLDALMELIEMIRYVMPSNLEFRLPPYPSDDSGRYSVVFMIAAGTGTEMTS
jgi:hypothetical protein